MGGRGQGGGEIGGGSNFSNGLNPYGDLSQITLEDAIGTQGDPKSMADAFYEANPYFSRLYDDYSSNCQRCVMAYEMRRRGYDVIALPTYDGDQMPHGNNMYAALGNIVPEKVGGRNPESNFKNIESKMKEWGEGSRAILEVAWRNYMGRGHVINLEYKNGALHFYDAQDGNREIGVPALKQTLRDAKPRHTAIVRTDTATVTEDMKYMVTTKRISNLS